MNLLPFLQLAFAAAALGWNLPGTSFLDRRPADDAVGLHLLRACSTQAAPLPLCRMRSGPVMKPPGGPVATPLGGPVAALFGGPVAAQPGGPVAAQPRSPVAALFGGPVVAPPGSPVAAQPRGPVAAQPRSPVAALFGGPVAAPPGSPVAAQPGVPVAMSPGVTVTTLLLNYSSDRTSPVTRQLLWIRCDLGMRSNLTVLLHDRTPNAEPVRWTVTSRCGASPKVLKSSEKVRPFGWRMQDVDAAVSFSLSRCSGLELLVKDESAPPSPSNKPCQFPAASRLLPKLSILLREEEGEDQQQQQERLAPSHHRWIHLLVPPSVVRNGSLEVRIDVVISAVAPPALLALSANCSEVRFSLAILERVQGTARLQLLSSQRVSLTSPRPSGLTALSGLSPAAFRSQIRTRSFGARLAQSRFLLDDFLPSSGAGPLGALLRVSFGAAGAAAVRTKEAEAGADLVQSRCGKDGFVTAWIDAVLAKVQGWSIEQFSVKAPFCKFSLDVPSKWILRFRLGDCGSLRLHDPLRSRVVFINTVSLSAGGRTKIVHSITCFEPLPPSEQIMLKSAVSRTPLIGEKVSINFTAAFYDDFNVLACGVYGGKFPIYNIYINNQTVENQLLFFDVLRTQSPKERRVVLRFKKNYPYGREPKFKIYCVVEGCTQGSLRKRTTDGLLFCSTGRHIRRSKLLVAFFLLKTNFSEPSNAEVVFAPGIHLMASVCIAAASFVLGMVTVFAVCCLCRRRAQDSGIRGPTNL